jgi:hypothetical protein
MVANVRRLRDANQAEAPALEALQRRSSDVREAYRQRFTANSDAIKLPATFIDNGCVLSTAKSRRRCSSRTPPVVTHLSHCYQKLDISSHEKLASALDDQREADARGSASRGKRS